jgi:hypothetical protein
MRGSWEREFAGHGPMGEGAATLWSRHEPGLHAGSGPSYGEEEGARNVAPLIDSEPRIEEREWLPGAERRNADRRLAERRSAMRAAYQLSGAVAGTARAPSHFLLRAWSVRDLIGLAVSLAVGFLGGLYVASSPEVRPAENPIPMLQLDKDIKLLEPRGSALLR